MGVGRLCAVEAAPALRKPRNGPVVHFDDIMDALRELDGEAARRTDYGKLMRRARRVRMLLGRPSLSR
ncbi:MAG: hypothetical protein AB7K04_05510 [Pseudorhodoplanes sp.]